MDRDALRLSPSTLARLPALVRQPTYDRQKLAVGMAHIGVGAFHRCHQATFTDDMLEKEMGRWGVIGINIRPPRLADNLGMQSGLYTSTLRQGDAADTRVIGCIKKLIDVDDNLSTAAALSALSSPDIDVVSLTLTEKGYCHVPSTGQLDLANSDVAADLANPLVPKTALGLLAKALELRKANNNGSITLISCDNIPANGKILQAVLTTFVSQFSIELSDWIEKNVAFPSTMVDRIVPATGEDDLNYVKHLTGVADLGAVVGEPFRQWVLDDAFIGRRPPWETVGAVFVKDVTPYELIKMRVLNAAQSTLSHLGALCRLEYSFEAAADPVLATLTRTMIESETVTTLPMLPEMELSAYIRTTFARIENTAIRHKCHQIGTDGSQKIVQRILNPLRERLQRGQPAEFLILGAASWIAYALAGTRRYGSQWAPVDPLIERVFAISDETSDEPTELARALLSIEEVFGSDLATDEIAQKIGQHIVGLLSATPKHYLKQFLTSSL